MKQEKLRRPVELQRLLVVMKRPRQLASCGIIDRLAIVASRVQIAPVYDSVTQLRSCVAAYATTHTSTMRSLLQGFGSASGPTAAHGERGGLPPGGGKGRRAHRGAGRVGLVGRHEVENEASPRESSSVVSTCPMQSSGQLFVAPDWRNFP